MKRLLFILLSLLMASCSSVSGDVFVSSNPETPNLQTKSVAKTYLIDEPYSFEEIDNEQTWRANRNIDDKCTVCQVPEDILSEMSTKALVQTCLSFPLVGTHCFYNNPIEAVLLLVDRCNFLAELILREDAAECLLDVYANIAVSESGQIVDIRNDEPVDIFSYNLIELLMGSGLVSDMFTDENKEILQGLVDNHLKMEFRHSDIFSYFSRMKCYLLQEELARGGVTPEEALTIYSVLDEKYLKEEIRTKVNRDMTVQVYTPFGRPVTGYCRPPLTQVEYNSYLAEMQNYPGVTILDTPTTAYNCFSYAWNMVEGGLTCWIYDPSPYLYHDNYEVTSSSLGEKVMYGSSHAGVVASDGYIHSKWGESCLVCHNLDECPYSTSSLTYYRTRTNPITDAPICGSDFVQCNVQTAYSLSGFQDAGYLSYVWGVEEYHGRDDYYSLVPNGSQSSITYYSPSEYTVSVTGYLSGTCVVFSTLVVNGYN